MLLRGFPLFLGGMAKAGVKRSEGLAPKYASNTYHTREIYRLEELAVRRVQLLVQVEQLNPRFWSVRLGDIPTPAEIHSSMVKRSGKGGDFPDQRKGKYYLSIDEWIASFYLE